MASLDRFIFNDDFVGKRVVKMEYKPNKNGLVSDALLIFEDGSLTQIGASKEGFLVITPNSFIEPLVAFYP
jgi:hypothetical protein